MDNIKIKFNGKDYDVQKGEKAGAFLKAAGYENPELLVVKLNGRNLDIHAPLNEGGELVPLTFADPEGKEVFWHSTSHIMATAVKRLYPEVKVTIGPAIDEGFYYDFDRETPFTEEDLKKIEDEMMKVIKENHPFKRKDLPIEEAKKLFREMGEHYKIEILDGIKDDSVSTYTSENFVDLCRGPHLTYSKKIKAVKLMKLAGAYWRGDSKNKMLQRIYGISFPSKEMLEEYLKRLEEAKLRDHRKIGRELDLFSTHDEFGPGLIYWHPKGGIIRKEIEDFWRNEHLKNGYDLIFSPHIAKIDLWNTSGHTGFYRENMFDTMDIDEMQYQLKPMNCPFHILMYNSQLRSYRELPLRWAELGTVYRYEKSGVLHGLMRVRGFTQDDAHLFMTEEQVEGEIIKVIEFITFVLKTFGFNEYEVYLSTRPPDAIGEQRVWDLAEAALRGALAKTGLKFGVDEGGGAFYGPKIDIKIKDALNRTWQCSTVQVDFNMPERFKVGYIGVDGKEHRAIMIHRALFGSLERFFGVLIEHYKGAFPVWLSPTQVTVMTITERSAEYAKELHAKMKEKGFRVTIETCSEPIGAKIKQATLEKTPYMIIVGDKEVESKTVSVRKRTGEETKSVNFDDFMNMVESSIKAKKIDI